MVMDGGAFTGEAREPQRKERLMGQLDLARRLRRDLEKAANRAEDPNTTTEKARQMIIDMTPTVNQLVSLTEAIRGNYTLDTEEDYHEEYNAWAQDDRYERDRQRKSSRSILRDQLRRMANPSKKWPKRTEVKVSQSTASGGSLAGSGQSVSHVAFGSKRDDQKDATKPRPITEAIANMKRKLEKDRTMVKRDASRSRDASRQHSRSSSSSKKRRSEREEREPRVSSEPRPDIATSMICPPSRTSSRKKPKHSSEQKAKSASSSAKKTLGTKVGKVRPDSVVSESITVSSKQSGTSTSSRKSVAKASSSPTTAAKSSSSRHKTALGPKKCHNCKKSITKWVKCQYLLPTGSKCGKYYCDDCLTKDYGQNGKKIREDVDDSWQ